MAGPRAGDVYGALLADVLAGRRAYEIVERDDGFMMAYDAGYLVAPFRKWDDPYERQAMGRVRGRALDVGCGGGRVCLHLQERGHDVVGIDSSPGAIEHCRQRGVTDARVLAVDAVDGTLGVFDSIVMVGQNFGMLGSRTRARRLLRLFSRVTTPTGRILAETFNPHSLDDPLQSAYLAENLRRGRMPGQLRVRVRYRDLATAWHDWLTLSQEELRGVLESTGWTLAGTIGDSRNYVAILEKVARRRQTPRQRLRVVPPPRLVDPAQRHHTSRHASIMSS
jgi:SAM-dependent methyltransferase